jgi:hypothetical protein
MVIAKKAAKAPSLNASSSLIRKAWAFSPMLTLMTGANVLFFGIALIGLFADPRLVLNSPNWAKTLKFSASVFIYGVTLLWMLSFVKRRPRAAKVVAFATGVILLFEMGLIMLQAVRGAAVHYNQSTPFDTVVWRVMSLTIFIVYAFNVVGAVLIARERFANPVLGLGVKLGIVMAMIGIGLGGLMAGPTAPQLAVLQSGGQLDFLGAHNVGALVDGGTRMLPILGWNMDGGDLRIPHFIGIHGAQFIPFVAAIAMALGVRGLSTNRQRALVWVGAAFYAGLTMLVTWQALRDESIVAPGAQTIIVGIGLVLVAAATILAIAKVNGQSSSVQLRVRRGASGADV